MRIQTGHTALGSVSVSNPNTIFPVHIRKRICEHKAIMIFLGGSVVTSPSIISTQRLVVHGLYISQRLFTNASYLPGSYQKWLFLGFLAPLTILFSYFPTWGLGLENRCSVHGENENNNKQIYMILQASLQGREFHPNIVV